MVNNYIFDQPIPRGLTCQTCDLSHELKRLTTLVFGNYFVLDDNNNNNNNNNNNRNS